MLVKLFSVLALVAAATATPFHSPQKRALPRLGGINLAGCDFGMDTSGNSGTSFCPGTDQITHFVSKGANLVRLPVGWQYLVGNKVASTSLDATFFATYDNLVQASLKAGAYVMIDIHNYARWNGQIIGQGGPTNDQFASLWKLLATKYKSQPKVIFGIMNEPHDVPDNTKWAATVQAAVNAIRSAGATSQTIAIPGNFYSHADDWLNGINAPLLNVKDPATGDKSLLILDVHKYLDSDGSGQATECTTTGVDTWTSLQAFLKKNGRQALISEIGGGNSASCIQDLGQSLKFLAANPAQYNGFAIWSAGSFDASYPLSITPQNGQDNQLFVKAIQPYLPGSGGAVISPSESPSSSIKPSPPTSSIPPKSTSSAAVKSSSTAPVRSSSTAPKPASSSLPQSSSVAPRPSSSTPKPSDSTSTGNLQTYKGALGGFAAPPVTSSNGRYLSSGRQFNFLSDALQGSCYAQMDSCQNAANKGGNKGDLTVERCSNQQLQACLQVASG